MIAGELSCIPSLVLRPLRDKLTVDSSRSCTLGTRGGRDQFKWDDVKEDKYRENYLGNSLHAAVGRWQKGRDITWYSKGGDKDNDQATLQASKKAEIQSIKDAEAEAMAEAL